MIYRCKLDYSVYISLTHIRRPDLTLAVLPVAEFAFVRLRLRRLMTVVYGTLFKNRLAYLPNGWFM